MKKTSSYLLSLFSLMLILSGCGAGEPKDLACNYSPTYSRSTTQCDNQPKPTPNPTPNPTPKADGTSNPLFSSAWHLYNNGTSAFSVVGIDHNVQPVWSKGITGEGVTVAIVDTGVMRRHEDLINNEKIGYSYNFYLETTDPTPPLSPFISIFTHGTEVAGTILATNNYVGSVGVAHKAKWISYSLLFEDTDTLNALAGTPPSTQNASSVIDISNNSWGAAGTGNGGLVPLSSLYAQTIQNGATNGRNGKGIVYVFAAGNEGNQNREGFTDDANYSPPQNLPQVITVAAVGSNGRLADYSTRGSVVLVSGLSQGYANNSFVGQGITTTTFDSSGQLNKYTLNFDGTSAATPNVVGVIALMLQANPALTYRQVRWILAQTSKKTDNTNPSWQPSALGGTFSHAYGYGIADADKAVELAKNPPVLGTPHKCELDPLDSITITPISSNVAIPSQRVFDASSCKISKIEFVQLETEFNHGEFGTLLFQLTSPNGYISTLSPQHPCKTLTDCDYSTTTLNNVFKDWTFGSVRHMNEAPNAGNGQWIFSAYSTTNDTTSRLGRTRLIIWGF